MLSKETLNNFLFTLFGYRKAKNIGQIVLIILIHAISWFLLFLLPLFFYPVRINDKTFFSRELIDKSLLVGIFYLNYYFLIPRFLQRRKFLTYGGLVLVIFLGYLGQHVAVRSHYFGRMGVGGGFIFFQRADSPERAIGPTTNYLRVDSLDRSRLPPSPDAFLENEPTFLGIRRGLWMIGLNNAATSFILLLLIGAFIRLSFSFIRNQDERKALENANLNAEVNFLKSQINPHFLFNTLNSIYAQAHSKSEKTEYSILQLSDLLRYVLYDSSEPKVDLRKDIQYLTNYIDLQRMRLSPKIIVQYEVKGNPDGHKIAPLLLISFIENAFKHGISYANASVVDIQLTIFEKTLTLSVVNPLVETNSFVTGGVGLRNVTRRLNLLYPGKHLLTINRNDHLYIVNLKLDLDGD